MEKFVTEPVVTALLDLSLVYLCFDQKRDISGFEPKTFAYPASGSTHHTRVQLLVEVLVALLASYFESIGAKVDPPRFEPRTLRTPS